MVRRRSREVMIMKRVRVVLPTICSLLWAVGWAAPTLADPITSTDGETPGVRLDVQEFKRVSGGAVMLRFAVVNGSESNLGLSGGYLGPSYGTVDGTYLVDLAGKKKYEVLRDADKNCI